MLLNIHVFTLRFFIFIDKSEKKEHESVKKLKLNNLMLIEDKKLTKYMMDKVTLRNVITFYSVAKTHNLLYVAELSIRFIERCFPKLTKTKNFSQLDFDCVIKIVSSSELNIHSEVEVFDAVNTWLKHKSKQRSKYAVQLLLKVRLALLSDHALKYIKNCNSSFNGVHEFEKIVNEFLCGKKRLLKNNPSYSLRRRCCTQNKFNLLFCGGHDFMTKKIVRNTIQVDGSNYNNIKVLSSMNKCRENFKAVCLKGEVYVFGGSNNDDNLVKIVEKYSPSRNTWKKVSKIFDDRQDFCACAFMDKIFMFGGEYFDKNRFVYEMINSCLQFDTKQQYWSDKSWKEVSGMNRARAFADCAVFQGSIAVSGGYDHEKLKTVESYDVFADKWSPMPSMINSKTDHSLVVVKNKLFVIAKEINSCEVFDNDCKNYPLLRVRLFLIRAKSYQPET